MLEEPPGKHAERQSAFVDQVGGKAKRKLKALRDPSQGVWLGLGMMGLIGWSVVVPTVLGAALGMWIDKFHPSSHSWTLALLMAGLALGCLIAWHWVVKEDQAMNEEHGDSNE